MENSEPLELDLHDTDDEHEQAETRYEGYADYRAISLRVAGTIEDAVEAYCRIDSAHHEEAPVSPELAAMARTKILSAAMTLIPEMQDDRENVDLYDGILSRWEDGDETVDDGYLKALHEDCKLIEGTPGWLFQMTIDLRTAAFKLGYIKAGREREVDERDPVEQETDDMLQE